MQSITKPIKRKTGTYDRSKEIVISIEPGGLIGFRLLRHKKTFYLPIYNAYIMAVKAEAEALRRQKAKEKKEKKLLLRRG